MLLNIPQSRGQSPPQRTFYGAKVTNCLEVGTEKDPKVESHVRNGRSLCSQSCPALQACQLWVESSARGLALGCTLSTSNLTRHALEIAFQLGGTAQMSWRPPVLEVFIRDFLGKERSSRENQKQIPFFSLAHFRQAPQRSALCLCRGRKTFKRREGGSCVPLQASMS